MTQRNTADTLAWYEAHTTTGALGFNPDGQCLKICRTARNLPGGWASARIAANATPREHRITDLAEIRRGMVMYFDDPSDGNPYGHIVTVAAVPARGARSLSEITVWSNSVQSGRVVKVTADYFGKHWGDPFQFAATWLNGEVLHLPTPKPPKPSPVDIVLRLAVTNIPRKVGPKAWARCFELMADKADIFAANEIGSKAAKALMLQLVRQHQLAQYGTRIGPNPIFWTPNKYTRLSGRQIRLHGPATGRLARKYPGYNSARYVTEVVLEQNAGGPETAVLNAHLVPNGRKNSLRWRRAARKVALAQIRELVREHREAGRIVVLLGDTNIRLPFFVVRGWRWLRGRGIDKVGVLTTHDRHVIKATSSTYPAPTDHKHGVVASVTLTRKAV